MRAVEVRLRLCKQPARRKVSVRLLTAWANFNACFVCACAVTSTSTVTNMSLSVSVRLVGRSWVCVRAVGMATAIGHRSGGKDAPGQASALHFGGRRVRRLPCGTRSSGPSPKLSSLTAFAPFRQSATSQCTKRAARAGRKPSVPQRQRGALPPARARLCGEVFGFGGRHKCRLRSARAGAYLNNKTGRPPMSAENQIHTNLAVASLRRGGK